MMERIFKIKTKTNPDPRGQYPSERRYSASIVIGLAVVFLQLFLYSILMGSLIIHKLSLYDADSDIEATEVILSSTQDLDNITEYIKITTEDTLQRLHQRIEKDLAAGTQIHYYINVPALICAGCFLMSLGFFFSFVTGVLAWKRWYIDHNITFFFLSSSLSTLTSAICLLLSVLTSINMNLNFSEYEHEQRNQNIPITYSLAMNIVILSFIGMIWSFLSTKIAYKGMKNGYPDDIVISKGGRTVEVSTVKKGSKNCSTFPPDIIEHFPVSGKLAKYLPRKENSNLPKAESNHEYHERVNKFLSGEPENSAK